MKTSPMLFGEDLAVCRPTVLDPGHTATGEWTQPTGYHPQGAALPQHTNRSRSSQVCKVLPACIATHPPLLPFHTQPKPSFFRLPETFTPILLILWGRNSSYQIISSFLNAAHSLIAGALHARLPALTQASCSSYPISCLCLNMSLASQGLISGYPALKVSKSICIFWVLF